MRRAIVSAVLLASLAWAAPAGALPPDGKRWRALTETTGVTAAQLAAVCPRDGESRCSGTAGNRNVSGWIWATDAPGARADGPLRAALLDADPPQVAGPEYLVSALTFVDEIRPTFFFSGYSSTNGYVGGWTASERDGLPVAASASYQHPVFNGSFFVGAGRGRLEPVQRRLAVAAGDRRPDAAGGPRRRDRNRGLERLVHVRRRPSRGTVSDPESAVQRRLRARRR